jgi:hypothetical protein
LAGILALVLGLAACGGTQSHSAAGNATPVHVAKANNNGAYVDAGPVTYQLQISRELNQYSTEDSEYVAGLPAGTTQPTATQEWYGVFLWAKNQTPHPQLTTDNFDIVDTQGNVYYPVRLDPAINRYAWNVRKLEPLNTEPAPDSTASFGPTQGGLLLFKLGVSAYANRPLRLQIRGPSNTLRATISLDL